MLYCVAGGTAAQTGFFADIEASDLDSCMKSNYYTSAYSAQAMLRIWTEGDQNQKAQGVSQKLRQIIFINSAAAFVGMPGYSAYAGMLTTCSF